MEACADAGSGSWEDGVQTRIVSRDEAAYILGQRGKTKAKLSRVSGAAIELTEGGGTVGGGWLEIRGTEQQRRRALKYVEFVMKQRLGPVDIQDPEAHDDLAILGVPAEAVSFITGKGGSYLRLVEDEWGTLLFFLQLNPSSHRLLACPTCVERLAIFGPERSRRGAQLKVMAAIEVKLPGFFTSGASDRESRAGGVDIDTVCIREQDYSYALGRNGATRKKLAKASGCIVEYVGHVAHLCGTKGERGRAKEYLRWLLRQRTGQPALIEHQGRDDATVVVLPGDCVRAVAGHRGSALNAIEEQTSTFCFFDAAAGATAAAAEPKALLIFGCCPDNRRHAESLVWERIAQSLEDDVGEAATDGAGGGGGTAPDPGERWAAKGEGCDHGGLRSRPPEGGSECFPVAGEVASLLLGSGGRAKRRVAAASSTALDLRDGRIAGAREDRARAKKYVQLLLEQRAGAVRLGADAGKQHQDLTLVDLPAEAASWVVGRQGAFLRLVEEEFEVMVFVADLRTFAGDCDCSRPPALALFGGLRERRGAQLKVMAAIESRLPGWFTDRDAALPPEDPCEGFATDYLQIGEDDYSYALGKGGATRRRIARASGCVIGYVGRLAYLSGLKKERERAREYLVWLLQQRAGSVEVDYACREDVTVLQVPNACMGFVNGQRGAALRAVEKATGTFCFIEGSREDPSRDPKPLLIFGPWEARALAEERIRQRVDLKLAELVAPHDA